MFTLRYCILISLIILSSSISFAQKKEEPPAGVEPQTQSEADSLSRLMFGEEKKENRGQALFESGRKDFEIGEGFLKEADSLHATGDTTLGPPRGMIGLFKQALGDTSMTSREMDTRKRAEYAFKESVKDFEKALEVAPEMKDVQLWLVATYDRLKWWDKSIPLYREILNERQGDDKIWFSYGFAALQGKQYDKAVTGFDQAIHINELVSGDPSQTPNAYRIYAGEAYLKTYQDQLALEMFRAAQAHATSTDSVEIQKTIDWIMWDNGGIATAEYRDAAFKAESESRWNDARESYLGGITGARTERARSELSYRLALVEYNYGAKTDALARLKTLVESAKEPPQEYSENYGKMLYSYANIVEQEGDRRTALNYYLQSTKVSWTGQGTGFIAIASIAANDGDRAIDHALKALNYPLTTEQKQAAYTILVDAYRIKGDWENMKKYRALMEEK